MKATRLSITLFALTASAGLLHAEKLQGEQRPVVLGDARDILAITGAAEDFSTFVAAVKAAGLAETLKGKGPFTVFAPNNAAFGALPEGEVVKLLEPENKKRLTEILSYHIIPRKILSEDAAPMTLKTVEGREATITLDGATIMIDGAKIIQADIVASNGIIHVIDKVISPSAEKDEDAAE